MTEAVAAAVIVAAGSGTRFGDAAKVLAPVGGRPMLAWVLAAIDACATVRESVIVTGAHSDHAIRAICVGDWVKPITLVAGGATRQRSVAAGVAATPPDLPIVVVHDGARPLVTAGDVDRCVAAAVVTGASIVATPVADTLKRVEDGLIDGTVPRRQLWVAQTPQAFARARLVKACAMAATDRREFTDEASIFETLGWPVAVVPGSRLNLKVTEPDDLAIADALMTVRLSQAGDGDAGAA